MIANIFYIFLKFVQCTENDYIDWVTDRIYICNTALYKEYVNNDPKMKKMALKYKSEIDRHSKIKNKVFALSLCIDLKKLNELPEFYDVKTVDVESLIYNKLQGLGIKFNSYDLYELKCILQKLLKEKSNSEKEMKRMEVAINNGYTRYVLSLN